MYFICYYSSNLSVHIESQRTQTLLADITQVYQAPRVYKPADHISPRKYISPLHYSEQRRRSVASFLRSDGTGNDQQPRAFLSEWLTYHSLAPALRNAGCTVDMAPYNLEVGNKRNRGTDLIISNTTDEAHTPLLGINIKLGKLKEGQMAERHWYDDRICAPSLHLSLGNWEVATREQQWLDVKDWLSTLVHSKLSSTGKIPYFDLFRQYVIHRLSDTIGFYKWKVDQYHAGEYVPNFQEARIIPRAPRELDVFTQKINYLQQLFGELVAYNT